MRNTEVEQAMKITSELITRYGMMLDEPTTTYIVVRREMAIIRTAYRTMVERDKDLTTFIITECAKVRQTTRLGMARV